MHYEIVLWVALLVPVVIGLICTILPTARIALGAMCCCVFGTSIAGLAVIRHVFHHGAVFTASNWLFLDGLSAYHYLVMLLIYCLSSAYAWVYFGEELRQGHFTRKQARLFSGLWCLSFAAMSLVLFSNNLGVMWVGVEATTLITAFLICIHVSRESMEAMWKYIVICSVGIAFAFMGTLLAAASAKGLGLASYDALLWTVLHENAQRLDPKLIKAAFIFLLVGYGTKAGLSPMHSWLPDAHSKAPAPVSAIFSGFMLNAALYCIMRYIPITESATGNAGWGLNLLTGFGLLSIAVAAVFILFQKDLKRLLAYHSVEHLGIIALGLGLGGLGTFAALFHTLNHSLCKSLSFFAAGRLGQMFGSYDMEKMSGSLRVSPLWGGAIFGSILALIGIAPFALFMSELQLVKAAVDSSSVVALILFLAGSGIVFVGALQHAIPLAWGKPKGMLKPPPLRFTTLEALIVVIPLALLLALGIWLPESLITVLSRAAGILQPALPAEVAHVSGYMP
jgi:hydrogenase-4 component F